MQRVGQHEQPRRFAIGILAQLVAHKLDAFGRAQIDIDHDAGQISGRSGNVRRRHHVDLADGLQNAGELAAAVAAVRCEKQAARR
jgi:hypothetical protein